MTYSVLFSLKMAELGMPVNYDSLSVIVDRIDAQVVINLSEAERKGVLVDGVPLEDVFY